MNSNFLNGVPTIVNGDRVIYATSSKKFKLGNHMDTSSLFSWYAERPEDNHLGLIDLFANVTQVRVPIYRDLFKNKQILDVNGINGRITYDLPVTKKGGVYTMEDTSDYSSNPGIEGGVFPIILNYAYKQGDSLTYSKEYGAQVIVSEDHEVEPIGENFRHWVKLQDNDRSKWFPQEKLKAGIQYFKVGHSMGEYSTQYSGLDNPGEVGTMTNEFILGNHRGTDVSWTYYASKKNFGALETRAADLMQTFVAQYQDAENDMFVYADIAPGSPNPQMPNIKASSMRVGGLMEFLALSSHVKDEVNQLMFARAFVDESTNGTKRVNEGLWHQWRRGRLIKYSRPGGITLNHIREAASYIFASRPDLQYYERRLKFKCGTQAYYNMQALFEKQVTAQTAGLAIFNGAAQLLPKNPITGTSLQNLSMEAVIFNTVAIPGIGMVEIEHDPALDYMSGSDRFTQGFNNYGYSNSTYSMVIYDATDAQYSNARQKLPQGTTLVENGRKGSIYYVKPEGDHMCWGYEQGRMPDQTARGVVSSVKTMTRSFWVHSNSAILNVDPSSTVIIELKNLGNT